MNLGRPIWFAQPWDYHLLVFAYDFSGWALAALVLVGISRE